MRIFLIDLNAVRQDQIEVAREDELNPSSEPLATGEFVRVVDEEEGSGYAKVIQQTADKVLLRMEWNSSQGLSALDREEEDRLATILAMWNEVRCAHCDRPTDEGRRCRHGVLCASCAQELDEYD